MWPHFSSRNLYSQKIWGGWIHEFHLDTPSFCKLAPPCGLLLDICDEKWQNMIFLFILNNKNLIIHRAISQQSFLSSLKSQHLQWQTHYVSSTSPFGRQTNLWNVLSFTTHQWINRFQICVSLWWCEVPHRFKGRSASIKYIHWTLLNSTYEMPDRFYVNLTTKSITTFTRSAHRVCQDRKEKTWIYFLQRVYSNHHWRSDAVINVICCSIFEWNAFEGRFAVVKERVPSIDHPCYSCCFIFVITKMNQSEFEALARKNMLYTWRIIPFQ